MQVHIRGALNLIPSSPMSQRRRGPLANGAKGQEGVPDMSISVMTGPPDRTPARRRAPKCHPGRPPCADVCAEEESMNGLIPRGEVACQDAAAQLKTVVQDGPEGHGATCNLGFVESEGQDQGRRTGRAVVLQEGGDRRAGGQAGWQLWQLGRVGGLGRW
jgi:hypothetical protein